MITLYQVNDIEKILKLHFDGMSTDDKPTETFDGFTITNGSEFIELDTGDLFKFDADSKSWKKQEKQTSEGGSSILIDKTLQNEGQAADAKAVGDALKNKADFSALTSYVQTSTAESTYAKKTELPKKGVAVTDASGQEDAHTQLNALLASLRSAGIIATE